MLPKFDPLGISLTVLLVIIYAPRALKAFGWQHWSALTAGTGVTALFLVVEREGGVSLLPCAMWLLLLFAMAWWALAPRSSMRWFPLAPLGPFVAAIMAGFFAVDVYASAIRGLTVGGAGLKDGLFLTPVLLLPTSILISYVIAVYRSEPNSPGGHISKRDDLLKEWTRIKGLLRYHLCLREAPAPVDEKKM